METPWITFSPPGLHTAFYNGRIIYNTVMVSATYQHEWATGIHVSPPQAPPSRLSPPLQVVTQHQFGAVPHITHQAPSGSSRNLTAHLTPIVSCLKLSLILQSSSQKSPVLGSFSPPGMSPNQVFIKILPITHVCVSSPLGSMTSGIMSVFCPISGAWPETSYLF